MFENLFIDYANLNFRKNPENIKVFMAILTEHLTVALDKKNTVKYLWDVDVVNKNLGTLAEYIYVLSSTGQLYETGMRLDKLPSEHVYAWNNITQMTPDISEEPICEIQCRLSTQKELHQMAKDGYISYRQLNEMEKNTTLLGLGVFPKDRVGEIRYWAGRISRKKIYCHECLQLYFTYCLDQIAKGVDVVDLINPPLITRFLTSAHDAIRLRGISARGQRLKTAEEFVPNTDNIHVLILQTVGYSLVKFLERYDQRKIKRCPYCKKFFIAKNKTKKYCYDPECNRRYERSKKRKQREDDPVKYM